MKRSVLVLAAAIAIVVGAALPAVAARAVGGWGTVFGNSVSCALSRASINSDNERAGGQVHNFNGCNSGNGSRTVPTGYLGIRQVPLRYSTGRVCGTMPPWTYNASTGSDLKGSTAVHYWSDCPEGAAYQGLAHARRWKQNYSEYETRTANWSPAINF